VTEGKHTEKVDSSIQLKTVLIALAILAAGAGWGVRNGLLPERVGGLEKKIAVEHKLFSETLELLTKQMNFTICKDNKDPVIRELLVVNCRTPEARRAEEVNGQ
jgi:hypothetical protein